MALTVTSLKKSIIPNANWVYTVTGLVNGSQVVTLPTPPAAGSFPPLADWVPTEVLIFPYNTAAIGALVTVDRSTIAISASGVVTFTVWANGATNALMFVY